MLWKSRWYVLAGALLCAAGWWSDVVGLEFLSSVEYKKCNDGSSLMADLYLPETPKPWPTILMLHGGAWFSGNKSYATYHARYAADHGFAVVAINYRLAPRYQFPAQLEDCRDALVWLAAEAPQYGFDRDRVAVYGYSAGAQLASLLGMMQNAGRGEGPSEEQKKEQKKEQKEEQKEEQSERKSPNPPADPPALALSGESSAIAGLPDRLALAALPRIRAVVAGGTPCEFSWIPEDSQALVYWLGDTRAAVPAMYEAASPIAFVDVGDPPIFLFHGTADRLVPVQSPQKMAKQLKISQVPHQLHIMEGTTHVGAFLDAGAREQAMEFLQRHLLTAATMSERDRDEPPNR